MSGKKNASFVSKFAVALDPAAFDLQQVGRQALDSYLAGLAGAVGGMRKLRWGRGTQGKSGGARIIYYFHSEAMPLYLLTLFAKNERANLSKAERNALSGLVDILVDCWIDH